MSKLRLSSGHSLRILDSKEKSDIELLKDCPKIYEHLNTFSKVRYDKIKESLSELGLKYIENPTLVRGLDYYNDLCFEIKVESENYDKKNDLPKDTLLGGGRYDSLIDQLQGKINLSNNTVPAIGY